MTSPGKPTNQIAHQRIDIIAVLEDGKKEVSIPRDSCVKEHRCHYLILPSGRRHTTYLVTGEI